MSERYDGRTVAFAAADQQPSVSSSDESRLSDVLEEYLAQIERGERPDRDAIVSRHPDLADQLHACLDGLDLLQHVAPELHKVGCPVSARPEAIGDFRIVRELGRGGMGVVYEAEQLSLGRRIALKVLPFAAMLDKQQLARFKNEARAAATLDHPNIVAIYSVGADRGVHYYAMQLIEGQSLAEMIAVMKPDRPPSVENSASAAALINHPIAADTAKAALPTMRTRGSAAFSSLHGPATSLPSFSSREYHRTIARLGIQAAEALDHAHQNGILHRDIKPANLLLDDTGKLWITDFGLARIEQDAGMTMTGDVLGTLRYMSPEQALAKRAVIDHRSDIYSLGSTLYELLTLQPAFGATDRSELLQQIAFDEPIPMRHINRRIPLDLQTIIAKTIEKDPADRIATAQELADDLKRFLDCQPIKARPATTLQRLVKWSRRHVIVVWSVAAVLLISALILVVAGLQVVKWYRVAAQQLRQTERQERIATGMSHLFQQLITSAEPDMERGPTYTVCQMLDDFSATLDEKASDQPEVSATLHGTIAIAYANLGFPEKAKPHFESALELRRRALDPNDAAIAATLLELGWNWFELHDYGKVNQCAKEALAIHRHNNASPALMVHALNLLQCGLLSSNKYDEAEAAAAEALTIAGDLDTTQIADIACVMHTSATTQYRKSNYHKSEQLAQQAVKLHRRLNGNRDMHTAWGLVALGEILQGNHKFHEAEAALREARYIFREHAEIWHKSVRAVDRNLIALWEAGDAPPEELQAVRQEIIAGYRELKRLNPDDPRAHSAFARIIYEHGNREQFAEGIAAYREAIRLRPIPEYFNNIGVMLFDNSQLEESIVAFRQAIMLRPKFARGHFNLAVALHGQGHREKAAEQLRIAIQIDREVATRDLKMTLRLDGTKMLSDLGREPSD